MRCPNLFELVEEPREHVRADIHLSVVSDRTHAPEEPGLTPREATLTLASWSLSYSIGPVEEAQSPLYHYVVVRADLPRGMQCAQIIHAAGESSPGNLPSGTHAVCLVVPGEKELWALEQMLRRARVKFSAIIENDSPYTAQLMAIGCAPVGKEVLRRFLSSLPLLK